MLIRQAVMSEYEAVRSFYHSVIDGLQGSSYGPKWKKDIYPAPSDLQTAIEEGTLYLELDDGRIAASIVANHKYNDAYHDVPWPVSVTRDEFIVLHLLGVHKDYTGRGCGRAMMLHGIYLAREKGMKAVRLDVIEGNLPAIRLFKSLGFYYVDTRRMFYEDTGWTDFDLYEYQVV